MAARSESIDAVRASRDGHEYHEAWTARKAMQLLLPRDDLVGIAVEGLSPADQSAAAASAVEIADLTVYYGSRATFDSARRVETVQFKYSIARADRELRAADIKDTIAKFAASYRDHKNNYGAAAVQNRLFFELITNRPVYGPLLKAISGIADDKRLTGSAKAQADQFKKAASLTSKSLTEFAGKCVISGLSGNLASTKRDLSKILVDWSATSDARATARLGEMRQMVRNKAGHVGTHRNVIARVDVLHALDLSDIDELLPCPASLADVGEIVKREQLPDAMSRMPALSRPLLVHATGGVGKTVFVDSLAASLRPNNEVVFFDCFGGGSYRAPEDARHLPKRGLIHIANTLACSGLCDPILPGGDSVDTLFRTFRRRLEQCVKTLSLASPGRGLVLIIDAIDNAAEFSKERHEPAFPTLLLRSLESAGAIAGVKVVVACRTERRAQSIDGVKCDQLQLNPFTIGETETYLRARCPTVTPTEIQVAQARSGGNARILEHLVTGNRGLLDPSEIHNTIELDDLLQARINSSLAEAARRGYKAAEINAFLAGLSVLPPPVPLEEYAGAHGMDVEVIQSFAADLAPLLDRTKHGLVFRDEPTETLIRGSYGSDKAALKRVAKNLLSRQAASVYAARALPGLLQKLGDGKSLFKLAFDERFPAAIDSTVGKRRVRYARLKAAVLHAANEDDINQLVRLLVELASIAAVDKKGRDYIFDNPDLVVAAEDAEGIQRLFEIRSNWPGARHARLSIANVLSGDLDEAARRAKGADEWFYHYLQRDHDQDFNRPHPERLDAAAIPIFLIARKEPRRAKRFMGRWYDWYAYEVGEHIFGTLSAARRMPLPQRLDVDSFLKELTTEVGCLAAALSFLEPKDVDRRALITKLARACARKPKLTFSESYTRERTRELSDGLRKAAAIAASLGLHAQGRSISMRAPHARPSAWSFEDHHRDRQVFPFLFDLAFQSALSGTPLHEKDILPSELVLLAKRIDRKVSGKDFRDKLKENVEKATSASAENADSERKAISYETKSTLERFIDRRLDPLLTLTSALAELLAAPQRRADRAFLNLLTRWMQVRVLKDGYAPQPFNRFFQFAGLEMLMFVLWARNDLKTSSVASFLQRLHENEFLAPSTLIEVIEILAARPRFHAIAAEQAVKAKVLIDKEDDVDHRGSLYARLSRAILHASSEEAKSYFKAGLEQMDAIGSGDHDFTSELLWFVSSVKGAEIPEREFHTLTNICELNMAYEEEKFPWGSFGAALSKVAGGRGLAKLGRWHDRSKVALECTLLPYLTALVRDNKIAVPDALALNRLADPAELWSSNTETFARVIRDKISTTDQGYVRELIQQFEDNNSGLASDDTMAALTAIADEILGARDETSRYLRDAKKEFSEVRSGLNDASNYHGEQKHYRQGPDPHRSDKAKMRKLAAATTPTDEDSMARAVQALNELKPSRELEHEFFDKVRARARFDARARYVGIVARLEHLDIYAKVHELEACKRSWFAGTVSLGAEYRSLAAVILNLHAEEFISFERLSGYQLRQLAQLCDVSENELCLELTKVFASPDWTIPAAAWLGLATVICPRAEAGQGQDALVRLLNSNAAQLTSTVTDGPWKKGIYPGSDIAEIASGLIWLMLGSPLAASRWRAAHSIRCFAKFERWNVIDALVAQFPSTSASPFQAPELPFYYLHARLWLVVALARIALDHPQRVAKYGSLLFRVTSRDHSTHVLIRHFAARTLLTCADAGALSLSTARRKFLTEIDESPLPLLPEDAPRYYGDHHESRPKAVPEPPFKFSVDYDFDKYDVQSVAGLFGEKGWKVKDLMGAEAHKLDPAVTTMYENGGRDVPRRYRTQGVSSKYHSYGHYLGWHALMRAAGRMLADHPVREDRWYGDSWKEWLHGHLLTRKDGFWLADGMDRPPRNANINVLERGEKGMVLTGARETLLSLASIEDEKPLRHLVVDGDWTTPDGVAIHISSSLVAPLDAERLATELIKEQPFFVWLPTYSTGDNGGDYLRHKRAGYTPWITDSSEDSGRLDDDDPLGVIAVQRRQRFAAGIVQEFALRSTDRFARQWTGNRGKVVGTANAWSYQSSRDDARKHGVRLLCSAAFLRKVLAAKNSELLLLIKLHRYESEVRQVREGRFSHTIAVLRIDKKLHCQYLPGAVNKVHENARDQAQRRAEKRSPQPPRRARHDRRGKLRRIGN